MEAATAVGLASSIIQLIGAARDVVSTAREIRKSWNGLSQEIDRFRRSAEVARKSLEAVITPTKDAHVDDTFRDYAKSMLTHVDAYLIKIDGLRVKAPKAWFASWKAAWKGQWMKGELQESMGMIDRMGGQITMHIVTVYLPVVSLKLEAIHVQNLEMDSNLSKKIERLIEQVKQMNSFPDTSGQIILQALQRFPLDQEVLKKHRQCLQVLYFKQLRRRQDEVTEAHNKTYNWILNPSKSTSEEPQQSRFCEWLCSDDQEKNVFWISGKPGAGKSTLMKYLAHHELLPNRMRIWTGSRRLIRGDYYFWKSGTKLQRSTVGLLRSLLYQVLRQERSLIDDVFVDDEWSMYDADIEFPQKTLRDALTAALAKGYELGLCFMFFIDGLDEFDDRDEYSADVYESHKLISLLRMFYNRPGVKLCVSSRIWNEFVEEFGQDVERTIRIDELTQGDIAIFIKEQLEDNATFKALAEEDNEYLDLVKEVTAAAQGVFLWVHLAILSLLDGLTNADRIWHLRTRLRSLPRELGDLYEHILATVPIQYRKVSALVLLAASASNLNDFRPMITPLVCLYIDEVERSIAIEAPNITPSQLLKSLMAMSKRLRAQCKGLLEANTGQTGKREGTERMKQLQEIFDSELMFSHRTVADFLRSNAGRRSLLKTIGQDVDMNLILANSGFASAKVFILILRGSSEEDVHDEGRSIRAINPHLHPCSLPKPHYLTRSTLDTISQRTMTTFLSSVENLDMEVSWPFWVDFEHLVNLPTIGGKESFLDLWINTLHPRLEHPHLKATIDHLAVRFMCLNYLTKRLNGNPRMLAPRPNTYPILLLAISKAKFREKQDLQLVQLLLRYGADPNERYADTTIWQGLFECTRVWDNRSKSFPMFYPIMKTLVEYGADLTGSVNHTLVIEKWERTVYGLSRYRPREIRLDDESRVVIYSVVSAYFRDNGIEIRLQTRLGTMQFTAPVLSMAQDILQNSDPEHADMHELVDPSTVMSFQHYERRAARELMQKLLLDGKLPSNKEVERFLG